MIILPHAWQCSTVAENMDEAGTTRTCLVKQDYTSCKCFNQVME